MKHVLSLLMIFVFLNATLWAYPPDYAGTGNTTAALSGVYAGVLVPSGASALPTTTADGASLGIFAIGIPSTTSGTSIAQGAGVLFASGAGYNLSITGVLDPKTSKLSAILFGQSNFTYSVTTYVDGVATTTVYSIEAEGSLTGTVAVPNSSNTAVTGPDTSNAARITGTATIDTFSAVSSSGPDISGTVTFSVNGFQQSSTYAVPTLSIPTASE